MPTIGSIKQGCFDFVFIQGTPQIPMQVNSPPDRYPKSLLVTIDRKAYTVDITPSVCT